LEGLAELLLKEGKISDENWLENELYPQVYRAIIHIVRSGEYKLYRDPRLSEFFAVDFILSDDL
jgi:tubulin polyglutamylase TTLL1